MRAKLCIFALLSIALTGVSASGQPGTKTATSATPILLNGALPVYPPIARAARVTGQVTVKVTVKSGAVVRVEVLSKLSPAVLRFLEPPTSENIKTWRFAVDVSGEFPVTYTYSIAGEETDVLTNPTVEILPSLDVSISARPVKPTVMY